MRKFSTGICWTIVGLPELIKRRPLPFRPISDLGWCSWAIQARDTLELVVLLYNDDLGVIPPPLCNSLSPCLLNFLLRLPCRVSSSSRTSLMAPMRSLYLPRLSVPPSIRPVVGLLDRILLMCQHHLRLPSSLLKAVWLPHLDPLVPSVPSMSSICHHLQHAHARSFR